MWRELIDSIPDDIKRIIKQGNERYLTNHHKCFMAQPNDDGTPKRTFLITDQGQLVTMQLHNTPTGLHMTPGQLGDQGAIMDPNTQERFPRIRALKKITVRIEKTPGGPDRIIPINYAIPIKSQPAYGTYEISMRIVCATPTASYKNIAKAHRLVDSKTLTTITEFATRNTQTHPNLTISTLVNNIYTMLTHSMTKN